jgi:hypothetical protein
MHNRLYLIFPQGAQLRALSLPGSGRRALPDCEGTRVLRLDGVPAGPLDMTLELDAAGPLSVVLVETRTGLPAFSGIATAPEPGTMRSPGDLYQGIPTDFTAVARTHTIPALGR